MVEWVGVVHHHLLSSMKISKHICLQWAASTSDNIVSRRFSPGVG